LRSPGPQGPLKNRKQLKTTRLNSYNELVELIGARAEKSRGDATRWIRARHRPEF
jgi:hypothetical protein